MNTAERIGMLNAIVAEHAIRRNYWLCEEGRKVVSAFDPTCLEWLARGKFADRYPGCKPEVEAYSDGSIYIYKPNTSKPYITIE